MAKVPRLASNIYTGEDVFHQTEEAAQERTECLQDGRYPKCSQNLVIPSTLYLALPASYMYGGLAGPCLTDSSHYTAENRLQYCEWWMFFSALKRSPEGPWVPGSNLMTCHSGTRGGHMLLAALPDTFSWLDCAISDETVASSNSCCTIGEGSWGVRQFICWQMDQNNYSRLYTSIPSCW